MALSVRLVKQLRTSASLQTKVMPCSECGTPLTVGKNTRKAPRCVACGIAKMVDVNTQMASKSGPEYEKWRNAMARRFAQG